jgi:CBS domain-containing protein
MKCEAIMKRNVDIARPGETAEQAARLMREADVGFLPVCDESRHVLGALTDRDLALRVLADGRGPDTRVSDVFTREVVSCQAQDEVDRARELMAASQKSRIVCLDADGCLAGVISLSDLAHQGLGAEETLREVSSREARLS